MPPLLDTYKIFKKWKNEGSILKIMEFHDGWSSGPLFDLRIVGYGLVGQACDFIGDFNKSIELS